MAWKRSGGKREGAGRKRLPKTQKMVKISTAVNPNIRKFLDARVRGGFTIAATLDEAIRGHFKDYFNEAPIKDNILIDGE